MEDLYTQKQKFAEQIKSWTAEMLLESLCGLCYTHYQYESEPFDEFKFAKIKELILHKMGSQ